jgi:hypothetical protein
MMVRANRFTVVCRQYQGIHNDLRRFQSSGNQMQCRCILSTTLLPACSTAALLASSCQTRASPAQALAHHTSLKPNIIVTLTVAYYNNHLLAFNACAGTHQHSLHPSLGRQLLSSLAASIWPPRDPIGQAGCTGAYCTDGGWGNYGYTQAVPAGGWGSNPGYTPEGYVRPVPLAQPLAAGGRH